MKLSYKINLVVISILVVMTCAVITAGTVIIGDLAFKSQRILLYSQLHKTRQVLTDTLNRSGLWAAVKISAELQTNLQQPPLNMKTARIYVFEAPDRVIFFQDYPLDSKTQWPLVSQMFHKKEGSVEYTHEEVDYYAVFTTIQPVNWLIVQTITKEEIFAQKKEYLRNISIITLAIFLLGAAALNLVVGRFIKRIQKTLHCIQQIEKGDLQARIHPIRVKDEIGTLQAGINAMSDRIRQRTLERQKAEESLRRYEHIISSTNDLMSFVDSSYIYQAVNNAYLQAHVKKREEIVGFAVKDLVGEQIFHKFIKAYLDRALAGEKIQYQQWFEYKGIGRRFMDVTYYPFRDIHSQNIDGVVVAVHDLTRQRQAEQEIRKKEEKLRFILNSLPGMVFEIDPSLTILWANTTTLGNNPEAIGKACHFAFLNKERACKGCRCATVFETGELETGMIYCPESDMDKENYLESIWVPLKDQDDQISSVLVISRNVTERELSRQRELKLQRELVHAHKIESIGTLAGGIAHDFNNILSVIIGYTELAFEDAREGSMLMDNLNEVYLAGKRAKDLVAQILTFARQSEEELGPIQPRSIVKEVLKFIRSTLPATIEIRQDIQADQFIMGSTTHVHQMLMNLCTNAAYAMETSGGILSVELKHAVFEQDSIFETIEVQKGEYLRIDVSDTGLGIDPANLEKIFEPYFTTKKPGEGTGMGLAMVHGIVESYHGKICVKSKIGQGTRFIIFLPVLKETHMAQVAYNNPEDLPTGNENILLVDDEVSIVRIGAHILKGLGYSVTTSTSSVKALALFKSKPQDFDLIISDITMPKMTGDVLAAEVIAIRPDIPVILCTGYSKKISADAVAEIGIKAYIYKPVVKADLAQTVREVLDNAKNSSGEG